MHNSAQTLILDTPSKIQFFRLCTLRQAVKLEIMGMHRSRHPSALQIVRREFHLTGKPADVLMQLGILIEQERGRLA